MSGSSAFAALEVRFKTGATLRVEAVDLLAGKATLTLAGGGSITVDASRITSCAPVSDESVAPDSKEVEPAAPAASGVAVPASPPEPSGAAPAADPPPALPAERDYNALVQSAAARYGVDAELLRRVLEVESGFNPLAISPKGAMGVAQLMPGTARDLGVSDPFDAAQGIDGAARLLHELLAKSGGRFVPALAAYNAGPGAVRKYGGVPPYRETIEYVARVLSLYATNAPLSAARGGGIEQAHQLP
ncbi:MAG: lytic transglycosylase domain-containing protein [Acidobacteria bacterium]|nr:lytic transglycosylase domain-containing protein [Acidobacteriota bacterium]